LFSPSLIWRFVSGDYDQSIEDLVQALRNLPDDRRRR